jgi:hypothetical protein
MYTGVYVTIYTAPSTSGPQAHETQYSPAIKRKTNSKNMHKKLVCRPDSPKVYADLSVRSLFRDVVLTAEVTSLL